jgi:tRNA1(Val) A37 N6-methylase TrmN6
VSTPFPDDETTSDAFLGGALMLRQPRRGYRAGIDPVMLAATCSARPGEQVLDCGAGVGTVGLAVARRLPGVAITLVEREPVYAALARANVADNGLSTCVRVIEADLTAPLSRTPGLAPHAGRIDHALANPPYQIDTDATPSGTPLKAAANAMPPDALDAWARFMAAMVRPGGTATVIHRAEALPALLAVFERRFGNLRILPIHPHATAPANRVIVRGIRGSQAPLGLMPPLIVHDATGFSPVVAAVLREGAALPIDPG